MTRIYGVDYAAGPANVQKLQDEQVEFVCRYLAPPGAAYDWKRLTKDESLALRRAKIKLVTVFEASAQRALSGRAGGVADARCAKAALDDLGAPKDAPVYFAVDFEAKPEDQAAVNAYLVGAASVLGLARVGIYGGYYTVKRALDAGVCKYGWQTYAWSRHLWDIRAQLRQTKNGVHLAGLDVDLNVALTHDFGQWYATPSPPPPEHPQAVPFPADDSFWTWLRWRQGIGEFAQFGPRSPRVRPNVQRRVPSAWWKGLRGYIGADRV